MPTSHRAEGRARGARTRLIIAGVVALVVVVAILVFALTRSGASTPKATPPTPTPTPSVTPSTPASPTPTQTTKPTTKPTKAAPSIAPVPASPPHQITIGSLVDAGFKSSIGVIDGHLIPGAASKLQRLETRGMPGSPGKDTVVLVGAANDRGTGALDDLAKVRTGETIALTTQTGTLTYRITALQHAAPNAVLGLPQVRAHVPGRLVVDCASYVGLDRTNRDLVVIAQLVKGESLRP